MAKRSPPAGQNFRLQPLRLVRLLVVDDYEPWRRWVRMLLGAHGHFDVVGEVADGLEAIQTAPVLKPDLILLDIGLPSLNGIDVATRIHELVPKAKILFVSEHNDHEIVTAALSKGACGYILKMEAASELLPAIAAVLRGEEVVSEQLEG